MHAAIVFRDFKQGLAKELSRFNANQARCALGAAMAALCAVLIANWLNLEKPYWAGISALVVSRSSYDASLIKGTLRIIGTIAGCLLALILLGTFIDNVFAILCLIFFASVATVMVSSLRGRDSYAWSMAGFMIVLLSIAGLVVPHSIFNFAFYRTFEISLGTIMAIIMSAIFNPSPPETDKTSQPSTTPSANTDNHPDTNKMTAKQESELVKQAISLALAMVSVPLIWKWLDLPGVLQIGVTSLILLQPTPVETWRKGILRLLGCVTGGSIGLFLLGSTAGHYLITWGAAYGLLIFIFSYIDHGDPRCSYMGLQAGIALTLTLVQGLGPGTELGPPITRLCGILAGLILWNIIHALFERNNPDPIDEAKN
ncbi:FUSC family protein [Desulfovibrio sp. JC022]|uniref:FUSC family protein n=1 Tax=Desulfovibrio sp. JC022 TaxID=2593642 RepID=UPI0013D7D5A3|nr:FUSC family protein [Desulfovibrio sp. JC022]NDV23548.1 hypothetical protein [Desulfovibrio sp. JC022]